MIGVGGLVVILSQGFVPPASAAATPCDLAERLATFDLAAARAEYVKLLESDAREACAGPGLRKVSESQRRVADALAQADDEVVLGHDAEALALVAEALDLDPSNGPAQDLLDTLARKGSPPKQAVAGFAAADALWNAGYKTQAREQAQKVAAEKAAAIPARFKSPGPSIASQVKDRTADVATYGSALAIVLVIVAAGLALVWKLWSGLVRRRFVNLGTFTAHPAPADKEGETVASPKLSGDLLKVVVAEEFAAASRATGTFRVVDASAVDLPDFLDGPEQLKPLGKLLQVLFRRSVLTLSATARELGAGEWQVNVQIATRRRVKRLETFEVPSSAGADASAVGTIIAAWAMCVMRTLIGWPLRRPTYPLGTTSWMSLARMRLAMRSKGPGAEEQIHGSLAHDHRNAAALAWLGQIQVQSPNDAVRVADGLNHLKLAADTLASMPTQRPRWIRGRPHRAHVQWEPLWFQISYARTVSLLHRYYRFQAMDPPQPDQEDLDAALAEGLALAQAIAETWLSVHSFWRRSAVTKTRREELATMLNVDDEYYLGVLAGALVEGVDPPPAPAGCTRDGRDLWEWVAKFDRSRELGELLGLVTTPSSHAGIQALYNIACVWTRIGRFDEALEGLRVMFGHVAGGAIPLVVAQVEHDPTLERLRKDPVHSQTLATMLAEVRQRSPQKELRTSASPAKAGRWTVEVVTRS